MKTLYPAIEPYAVHHLDTEDGHRVYFEEAGNPKGLPVVYLHGGPGSGCKSFHRSFFDPARYRVILLDQRGAGRSAPAGGLENNTTAHLLADLEAIRSRLGLDRWLVFGGSWGAALGLLYAQAHPDAVSGLILRGTFLARQRDLEWFVKDGVSRIYPDYWDEFLSQFPPALRDDPLTALHRTLIGEDELARLRAAKAWILWSARVSHLEVFNPSDLDRQAPTALAQQARIEAHYAAHSYFIDENQILDNLRKLPQVPTVILHGRRDLVCPIESAYLLHRNLSGSELRLLPDAGHLPVGDAMIDALVGATDEMADRLA
ncbi:prolyl aminopeptidase [Methylococcus sp. EFPC2]|uniref:prolyl aminopeptidase n=1 Tax=Methylococcus sp. EFPC2 TaxID=2812648 RepID=UPI001967C311|nr:prolyl aminopeptidase [Methylococcus sp. EFPC2]QSA98334.1 prolyl aminopeptidase [Methylococcus sp. EFPC2]